MNFIESDNENHQPSANDDIIPIDFQNNSESFPIYNDEQDIYTQTGYEN